MKKNVLRATLVVFVLSLISKIIGFLKSIIQASYFGSTLETDAFNLANEFVNNVIFMFATAIAVAFVPTYIQRKKTDKTREFAAKSITGLLIIAIMLTVAFIIAAPVIVWVIAPGYDGYIYNLTIRYFRVLALCFVFALLTQLYSSLLNAEKIYGYSAVCSIVNSLILITFIIAFSSRLEVWALVLAVPVSFFSQFIVLFLKSRKYVRIIIRDGIWDESIKKILALAIPVLISQASVEINQVVDRALLISLGEGVLTAVTYSIVLYQFVSALITAPLSTVIFTELSEAAANNDHDGIKSIIHTCFKLLAFICVPIVLIICFDSVDIVSIVYGHGRFDNTAVKNCAIGLRMYSLCLLPVCFKTVLSRAYFATNNTKRPMIIGIMEVALNIMLSILFVRRFEIVGVVGATAIACCIFILVMIIDYSRKFICLLTKNNILSYWKIFISGLVTGVILQLIKGVTTNSELTNFLFISIICFTVYLVLLLFLRESILIMCLKKTTNYTIKTFLDSKKNYS